MGLSFWTDRSGANSADLDRSSLIWVYTVCHSVCMFRKVYSMVKPHCSNFRILTATVWVSKCLGILQHVKWTLLPFMNGWVHLSFQECQLDFIVGSFTEFTEHQANNGYPDQMLHSAASDLCLHCLSKSPIGDAGTNEPPHDKTNKMACAPSEDLDQPGHLPSLIRVFAVRSMGS